MLGLGLGFTSESVLRRASGITYAWTPLDLGASLKAWWNADDHGTANMTDDGAGLISSFKDRISAITLTGTTTARPTWAATSFNSAYAGLTFDGVANNLGMVTIGGTALPLGATAGNLVALVSQTNNAGQARIFGYGNDGNNARSLSYSLLTVNRFVVTNEAVALTDTVATFTGPHILAAEFAGTVMSGWIDGTATTPTTATIATLATATGGVRIGARPQTPALFHKGVFRHGFVTTQLTTLQRQQLEGWCAWDVGLASLLPSDHPFKLAAPTVVRMWQPTDLGTALKAWWNADDHGTGLMVDDGAGLISSWTDRVSGIAVTGTTTARPTWAAASYNSAYAGVTFDGVANQLGTVTYSPAVPTGAVPGNIAVLHSQTRPDVDTSLSMIFGYGQDSGNTRALYRSVSGVSRLNVTDSVVSLLDTSVTYNGNHIAIGEWAGTTQKGWIDGTATTPTSGVIATLATSTTGGLRIAARMQGATLQSKGVYRHVLVTLTLTLAQRQQLEGWLAWDVGLTSLLPAGHPYKSARP